jgi:hypothetical protein
MDNDSIPHIGSRTSVQLFAADVLSHQGLVQVETYQSSGYSSVLLGDGVGVKIALTGTPEELREVLEAALAATSPSPEPPAASGVAA